MIQQSGPINVCGFVVHANPERMAAVTEAIRALPGVDIHGESGDGRLIVTAIDTDGAMALDQVGVIQNFKGVVSTSLAYHQIDGGEEAAATSTAATDSNLSRRA